MEPCSHGICFIMARTHLPDLLLAAGKGLPITVGRLYGHIRTHLPNLSLADGNGLPNSVCRPNGQVHIEQV